MEKIAERALLFDFYGPLLTQKQSMIWDLHYQEDYSLSEIAVEEGISRQAVYDILKRTEKILQDYENKLKLIEKFIIERDKLASIEKMLVNVQKVDFINEEAWARQVKNNLKIRQIISGTID